MSSSFSRNPKTSGFICGGKAGIDKILASAPKQPNKNEIAASGSSSLLAVEWPTPFNALLLKGKNIIAKTNKEMNTRSHI